MNVKFKNYLPLLILLLAIFSCSVWGRQTWSLLVDYIGRSGITLLLAIIAVLAAYLAKLGIRAMLLGACMMAILYFFMGLLAEELLHFILFGALGIICADLVRQSYAPKLAMLILGLTISVLDEVLQAYLPNRVGDINDVMLNSVSFVVGYYYRTALAGSKKYQTELC